ncbi:MAG: GNAT family N-acetyltransferase [Bacteroidota bacterium]
MENGSVVVRKMTLSDMPGLMRLKNEEGWNQTEQDWELLVNYKEAVNLVALLDQKIVGTVTGINYAGKVAWIGMMLIDRDYRGRGLSKPLLNGAIAGLENCESIKLDATPAGLPVYRKINFVEEYEICRMTHPAVNGMAMGERITPVQATAADMMDIAQLDEQVFGASRENMLSYLFHNSPELSWVLKEGDEISGFCMGRRGVNYTQVGPLFAYSDEGAKALMAAAVSRLSGKAVVLDILADKSALMEWLKQNGFETQRSFVRMYLDNNPHPGVIGRQYLISGPELG